jgi:putative ATP-dependent endonuclease of OLD family
MYLCRLEIENFRGIHSARLDFGDSTVLIGENDSGKSTLLEAVCLVLSSRTESPSIIFSPRDFFMVNGMSDFHAVGPIVIRLVFRERKPDEWSFMRKNDLGIDLPDDVNALQEVTLEIRANPVEQGGISKARWRICIEGRNEMDFTDDPVVLSWIRRLNPVFRIKSGVYFNAGEEGGTDYAKETELHIPGERTGNLMEKIRSHYQNLISGISADAGTELQAGYKAAMQYLGQTSNLLKKETLPLEQVIYEILGRKPLDTDQQVMKTGLRHGSAAEKIGLLLFTTALLQSGSPFADPSAEPIIIIEDPEAHLHPMTLESVNLLISRLKWQKIITTQSGSLLASFPLEDVRRISRHEGRIRQHRVKPGNLSRDDLRRLSYHVRMRQGTATFARCWLLVEGESEVWLLPHLARLSGYDLAMEGIVCIEFAQCGLSPLIKAAGFLGIEWYVLADGDAAGKAYLSTVRQMALQSGFNPDDHCMRLKEPDIEHHLYYNGYPGVYEEYSGLPAHAAQYHKPRRIISRAIHRHSKPFMAVAIVEAIARKDSPGVPPILKKVIEKCVGLAKEAPGRRGSEF